MLARYYVDNIILYAHNEHHRSDSVPRVYPIYIYSRYRMILYSNIYVYRYRVNPLGPPSGRDTFHRCGT